MYMLRVCEMNFEVHQCVSSMFTCCEEIKVGIKYLWIVHFVTFCDDYNVLLMLNMATVRLNLDKNFEYLILALEKFD